MALHYCPRCGAELEDDAIVCPSCSSTIEDWSLDLGEPHADTDDNAGSTSDLSPRNDGEEGLADDVEAMESNTIRYARAVAYKPLRRDTSYLRQTDEWSLGKRFFIYLGGGIIGVFVIVALAINSCSARNRINDPQASRVVPGGYVAPEEGENQADQGEGDQQEDQASFEDQENATHDALKAVYDKISPLAHKVENIEDSFETDWLNHYPQRKTSLQQAKDLKAEADKLLAEAQAIQIADGSEWADQKTNVVTCCESLAKRADIMEQMWETDVSYSYPMQYTSTVHAPRTKNSDKNGEVIPVRNFNESYAKIEL